jgi:hypothetical protein
MGEGCPTLIGRVGDDPSILQAQRGPVEGEYAQLKRDGWATEEPLAEVQPGQGRGGQGNDLPTSLNGIKDGRRIFKPRFDERQ